jgi:hypothetical protein
MDLIATHWKDLAVILIMGQNVSIAMGSYVRNLMVLVLQIYLTVFHLMIRIVIQISETYVIHKI